MKKLAILSLSAFCISPYFFSDVRIFHSPDSPLLCHLPPSLSSPFISTPYLNLGVLQSIFGSTSAHLPSDEALTSGIFYSRSVHRFPDGGSYSLDWAGNSSARLLLLIPGLTGGSEALYIKHLVLEAVNRGYVCAVFNGRGINGTPLTVK
jgi:predicted alpha/beta-fold hydrolase